MGNWKRDITKFFFFNERFWKDASKPKLLLDEVYFIIILIQFFLSI